MKEKAAANSTNPSIPAKAGISAAIAAFADRRPLQCSAFAEFPADAGKRFPPSREWKGGREWKKRREWKCEGVGNGSAGEAGIEVWRGRE